MPNPSSFPSHRAWLAYYAEYRRNNREKLRAYSKEYNREWRKKNGYHNEINSQRRYPIKVRARQILTKAIKDGYIKRGSCEVCQKPKAQGHHDDYRRPLVVRWRCPVHHAELHPR